MKYAVSHDAHRQSVARMQFGGVAWTGLGGTRAFRHSRDVLVPRTEVTLWIHREYS